jgi:hypothetical protein
MKIVSLLLLVQSVYAGCKISSTPKCYVDDETRILGAQSVSSGGMISLEYCAQLCANHNFTLAGAEVRSFVLHSYE